MKRRCLPLMLLILLPALTGSQLDQAHLEMQHQAILWNELGSPIAKFRHHTDLNLVIRTAKHGWTIRQGKAEKKHRVPIRKISKRSAEKVATLARSLDGRSLAEFRSALSQSGGEHDVIELPTTQMITYMLKELIAVDQDSAGIAEGGGVIMGNQHVLVAYPGQKAKPKSGCAHVDIWKVRKLDQIKSKSSFTGVFHGHPSGKLQGRAFIQSPSVRDWEHLALWKKEEALSMEAQGYVFGLGNKMLYVYDERGISATMPWDTFLEHVGRMENVLARMDF